MSQKEEIVKLYRRGDVAETFDRERDEFLYQKYKHKIEANILKKVLEKLKSDQKVKILDVACGTGRMLPVVLEYKVDYTGLDTSKSMTKYLREKAKKMNKEKDVKLVIGDATKIPFKDESFDFVFSYHLTWHLPPESEKKMILEMQRVTKRGGYFVFDILNSNFISEKIKKISGFKSEKGIYKMGVSEIKKLLLSREYFLEKLSDAKIKNSFLYSLFNLVNIFRKVLPINLYHMVYFIVKK